MISSNIFAFWQSFKYYRLNSRLGKSINIGKI